MSGIKNTRPYAIHRNMKQRCYNPNNTKWDNYGGKGIKICDEWISYDYENKINTGFLNFYNWAINNGYDDTLTIDRIDPNGNYCPENCRWVDRKFQCNNKNDNRYIEYMGYNFTVSIWSEITHLSTSLIYRRLQKRWSPEQTLRIPPGYSKHDNVYLSWCVPVEYIKYHNPDTARKQTNAVRGPMSEETKKKISDFNKGRLNADQRKLTDDQVFEIYRLKREGYSNRKLGEMFNIVHTRIHDIVHGKAYMNCFNKFQDTIDTFDNLQDITA